MRASRGSLEPPSIHVKDPVPHTACQRVPQAGSTKILQARLQQYMNCELRDVHAGFRKGKGIRDQIANIYWIIEKAKEF